MHRAIRSLTGLSALPSASRASYESYDTAIRQHIDTLKDCTVEIRTAVLEQAEEILQRLDPVAHSISYLFVLDILLDPKISTSPISRQSLLDKILEFLVAFDHIQIRYVGSAILSLLEKVASGQLFSPLVSVELLSTAMLRIDNSASCFTSTHLLLAKLAYHTNAIEPALHVLNRDILVYPGVPLSQEPRSLCDPTLAPASYISTHIGLTQSVTAPMVLEYNHLRGLIYISRRQWDRAQAALGQIITHPTKDTFISKIMVESYKRWLLVGLVNRGKVPEALHFPSTSASTIYMSSAKPYLGVAEIFITTDAEKLKSHIQHHVQTWHEDGTTSLLAEILSWHQKWQIIRLRGVYQRIGVAQIRNMTANAETGRPLEKDEEVLALLHQMIDNKILSGTIERENDETYLAFRQDSDVLSEKEFALRIAQSRRALAVLGLAYRQMNENLRGTSEYVQHVIKEKKRTEKQGADAGIGFESQIEDEDLMAGIVAHG